jgi:hypothetical protein
MANLESQTLTTWLHVKLDIFFSLAKRDMRLIWASRRMASERLGKCSK